VSICRQYCGQTRLQEQARGYYWQPAAS
jgi:hypothetical protein